MTNQDHFDVKGPTEQRMKPEDDPKVQEMERLLQAYYQEGGSASASKISKYTQHALKNLSLYKMTVWSIERYLAKCPLEYRIHGLYTVDALMKECKKSSKSGSLMARIEQKLPEIFGYLFKHPKGPIGESDVSKVARLFELWRKSGTFSDKSLANLANKFPQIGAVQSSEQSATSAPVTVAKAEPKPSKKSPQKVDPLAFDYGEGNDEFQQESQVVSPVEKPQSQAILNISQQLLDSISSQINPQSQTIADPRMAGLNYDPRKVVRPPPPMPILDSAYLASLTQSILPQLAPAAVQAAPAVPMQQQIAQPAIKRPLDGYFINKFPIQPDNPQRIKHQEHSLPMDCIRVLSRTLFVGNIPKSSCTNDALQAIFQPFNLESLNLMTEKQTCFVKFVTREDTERCKRELHEIEGQPVKVSYGCGFGPKECFDRRSGITMLQGVSTMTDDEYRRVGKELGQQFLAAYWSQIVSTGQIYAATVSPMDREKAESMGGFWCGGLVIEEPDIVPTSLKRPRQ